MPRMTNKLAREIVNDWLKKQGKPVPWSGHNYVDYVTEVRISTGVDALKDALDVWIYRDEACAWLRCLAYRIRDKQPIRETLTVHELVN